MAWVAKKKRTRWLLGGKVVPANTPGASKKTTSSEFYYAFWYDTQDGRLRQEELRGCTEKKAARARLNEILSRPEEPRQLATKELPLRDYLEDYLKSLEGIRKEKTRKQARTYLNLFVEEVGRKRMGELAFNEGLEVVAGEKARYKMQKNICSMINSFLRFVCKKTNQRSPRGGFYQAPPDDSYVPAKHGTLTVEEAGILLAKMAEESSSGFARVRRSRKKRWLIYWLMLSTLTRFKTITELLASQFQLEPLSEACVHLRAGQTKSRRAVTKPLPAALAAALQKFLNEGRHPEKDRPLSISFTHFYLSWQKDLAEAGLRTQDPAGRILAPHSLKATGITLLLDQGLDLATVAELAEHTDVRLTLNIYNDHVLRKRPALKEHLEKMQRSLEHQEKGKENESGP